MSHKSASRFAFVSSGTPDAKAALESLSKRYGQASLEEADIVVALGGDGFLLQTLRETMGTGKKVYGMNRGTIGFLMNEYRAGALPERIEAAVAETIRPLEMQAATAEGNTGSTAYNLSAHGPILPLDAPLLALTPVSPFRPRNWRGALLSDKAVVRFDIREPQKRPVNAAADHTEVKGVTTVTVRSSTSMTATLLFDPSHSWNERILSEQFRY